MSANAIKARRADQEYLKRERMRLQTLAWAQGTPQHNHIDNECCPDFSCCDPKLFERDDAKRWALYHEEHGGKQ